MTTLTWPAAQPTLQGDGVLLRPWRGEDADAVLRACQDPDIQRFTRVPIPYERVHAETFAARSAQEWAQHSGAAFAVVSPIDDSVLASCGLVGISDDGRSAEAGYWVGPWARRQGVGARALRALHLWAVTDGGLAEVWLQIDEENPASARVASAAGFVRTPAPPTVLEHRGIPRSFARYEIAP